jgi:branched-chain amino acid transport system substrate-binding protein
VNAGKNGNGTTMPQTFIEKAAATPKQIKFVDDYHKKFNENPITSAVSAAQGYDSMYLLKLAIEQAGTTDGPKVKAALENLNATYEGVTGTYTKPFSPTDHEAVKETNVRMGVIQEGNVLDSAATATKK